MIFSRYFNEGGICYDLKHQTGFNFRHKREGGVTDLRLHLEDTHLV